VVGGIGDPATLRRGGSDCDELPYLQRRHIQEQLQVRLGVEKEKQMEVSTWTLGSAAASAPVRC
jgi:hypothetical protein